MSAEREKAGGGAALEGLREAEVNARQRPGRAVAARWRSPRQQQEMLAKARALAAGEWPV